MELTIFTPTFNRVELLKRLYFNLLSNEAKSFEWVIVDDGSSDETNVFIESILPKSPFPIKYIYQYNQGKHAAINTGLSICKGKWFFIVDSDDYLIPNILVEINNILSLQNSKSYLGICFRKAFFDGKMIGNYSNLKSPTILKPNAAGLEFKGDLAYIFQTTTLQSLKFPIIPGEFFFPELFIWNKISDQGDILYYPNKVVYHAEYREDGYTKQFGKIFKKNPIGFLIFYLDQIKRSSDYTTKLKSAIRAIQCLFNYLRAIKK